MTEGGRALVERVGGADNDWDIALLCHPSSPNNNNDTTTMTTATEGWDDIAIEQGFEYVPRSCQALDRIKEALQAHPWPTTTSTTTPSSSQQGSDKFDDDFLSPFQNGASQAQAAAADPDEIEDLFAQAAALRNAPAGDLSIEERRDRAEALLRRLLGADFD